MTAPSAKARAIAAEFFVAEENRAELATLIDAHLADVRSALFVGFNVLALTQFEPDPGKPHPVKDGTWDKTIAKMKDALAALEPAP